MEFSRRDFIHAVSSVPALPYACFAGTQARTSGIQLGAITYSYRDMPLSAGSTLAYARESGVRSLEFMFYDLELEAGAPVTALPWKMDNCGRARLKAWRKAVDPKIFEPVRVKYESAGVFTHIVKYGDIDGSMSDEDLDFRFAVARAMGAKAITREIPNPRNIACIEQQMKRLGAFAEKWNVFIAFHNHSQVHIETYDGPLLGWSDKFRINFDIGNYVASNDRDALEFVRKYSDRIFSIHLKDRHVAAKGGKDVPFGNGDTPIERLFDFMCKEGYSWPCDVEMEYEVPFGSNAVREVDACRAWCVEKIKMS